MVGKNSSLRMGRWLVQAGLAAFLCGSVCGEAIAQDRFYVAADGTKTRMVESKTEMAVILRDVSEEGVASSARRLATSAQGTLENLWGDPRVRIKVMRVADTSVQRRDRIRQDSNIEAIRPIYRFEGTDSPIVPTGELIFKTTPGLNDSEFDSLLAEYALSEVTPAEGLVDTYLAKTRDGGDELLRAELMAEDPRTVWVQPNLIQQIEMRQTGINDTFYSDQWHITQIQADEAWLVGEGQDILVGMFDDSCDVFHEDLRDRYIGVGQDASLPSNDDGYNDPRPKELDDRHGTSVMGLAVASANDVGVRGISYLSRFTASRGLLDAVTDFQIASVFTFARQQDVDVHINSWGLLGRINPQVIVDAIEIAYREGRDPDGSGGAPPLGMVILFATGNDDEENTIGSDLSSLPYVIGVGASNSGDRRASYSNYGSFINILAPSGDNFPYESMTTTDNTDELGYAEPGYNDAGSDDFGMPELDAEGNYTKGFSGTSAACPVASGVAALVLSVNPLLSARDVRLILEHTTDMVTPTEAIYHGITSRSFKYGYGRINALKAVNAADDSLTNGGRTWPERVGTVEVVDGNVLRWVQSFGTDEFLIVQSDSDDFAFIPEDSECYDSTQTGCGSIDPDAIADLPEGVEVLYVGCSVGDEACAEGVRHGVSFETPAGRKFFGIYSRSSIGRYSFGVAVDSDGNVFDANPVTVIPGGDEGGTTDPDEGEVYVSITASPTSGSSPLTVMFSGNAVSTKAIDDDRTGWDFDVYDANIEADATSRHATAEYTAPEGMTRSYTAKLTMADVDGTEGSATVRIIVDGRDSDNDLPVGGTDLAIMVGVPGTVGSDQDVGTAPFEVELSINADSLEGTFQSVYWDLGDGTDATSISVPHTYYNTTDDTLRYVVTAIVTTKGASDLTYQSEASRVITVAPGTPDVPSGNGSLDGTGATGDGGVAGCGVFGLFPALAVLASFPLLRRRFT